MGNRIGIPDLAEGHQGIFIVKAFGRIGLLFRVVGSRVSYLAVRQPVVPDSPKMQHLDDD